MADDYIFVKMFSLIDKIVIFQKLKGRKLKIILQFFVNETAMYKGKRWCHQNRGKFFHKGELLLKLGNHRFSCRRNLLRRFHRHACLPAEILKKGGFPVLTHPFVRLIKLLIQASILCEQHLDSPEVHVSHHGVDRIFLAKFHDAADGIQAFRAFFDHISDND